MDRKRAKQLGKSLIVDLDGVMAAVTRPPEERHSAAASAAITVARLFGGLCINFARIADALDDLADHICKNAEPRNAGPEDDPLDTLDPGDRIE